MVNIVSGKIEIIGAIGYHLLVSLHNYERPNSDMHIRFKKISLDDYMNLSMVLMFPTFLL